MPRARLPTATSIQTGETTHTSGTSTNPFLYTGQELDSETGFYHLRARHYAPKLGKFLSRDPIGYAGGSNLYSYCGGDPINSRDPSGLLPIFPNLPELSQAMSIVQPESTRVITDQGAWTSLEQRANKGKVAGLTEGGVSNIGAYRIQKIGNSNFRLFKYIETLAHEGYHLKHSWDPREGPAKAYGLKYLDDWVKCNGTKEQKTQYTEYLRAKDKLLEQDMGNDDSPDDWVDPDPNTPPEYGTPNPNLPFH